MTTTQKQPPAGCLDVLEGRVSGPKKAMPAGCLDAQPKQAYVAASTAPVVDPPTDDPPAA